MPERFHPSWSGRSTPDDRRGFALRLLPCVLLIFCPFSCKPKQETSAAPAANPLAAQLAGARYDAAQVHLSENEPDKALLLLVSSLKADPSFPDSVRAIRDLLAETQWSYPAARINTELPVTSATVSGTNLWTTLTAPDGFTTTARWDLGKLTVESVLFPRKGETTPSFLLSPDANRAVITRADGNHATTLLCDAVTLRPVLTLCDAPADLSFPQFVRFSPDSLLLANAEPGAASLTWHIRDLATGEILRSHTLPSTPPPVAANLDREHLVIHLANSTSVDIPVSPVAEITTDDHSPAPAAPPQPPAPFLVQGNEIEIQRLLALPKTTGRDSGPLHFNPERILSLTHLAQAVTGLRFDEKSRAFIPLAESERRSIIAFAHHPDDLLDGLDFTPVIKDITSIPFRESTPAGSFKLRDRLARAQPPAAGFLALKSTAVSVDPTAEMAAIFAEGDHEKILAAIRTAVPHSPASARGLLLSLTAGDPESIRASLERNPGLPRTLEKLALSRLAWVEHRQPESIALWQSGYPDIPTSLRTEDWNGWESAGFPPLFEAHFAEIRSALASFAVSGDAPPEQQRSLSERLLDPTTTGAIGRERHAAACLEAARTSSNSASETDTTLELLTLARALGASPSECLRVEATTHMTAGNFSRAHECWISLITDFPTDTHQPLDYAEAAYTAFETGDEEQALAILGTGVTRFPGDPDFAYRAGWISLLTGRFQEAGEFLWVGERAGYPAERLEKATAMLVIACAESGSLTDASRFADRLVSLDPSWAEPDPPKAESWPPELKAVLHEITSPPKAVLLEDAPAEPGDMATPMPPEISDLPLPD